MDRLRTRSSARGAAATRWLYTQCQPLEAAKAARSALATGGGAEDRHAPVDGLGVDRPADVQAHHGPGRGGGRRLLHDVPGPALGVEVHHTVALGLGYREAVAFTLPRSLDKRLHTVDEEVAFARSLTAEQRLEVVASVCRSVMAVLELHSRRDEVLRRRDPLPDSTVRALERLRKRG